MRIQNYITSFKNRRKRISAEIVWESADRPREEIYFEVDEQYRDDLSCNPDAFFLATIFPALYYGEERYSIEGRVCPVLYQGVKDVLGFYYHWYFQNRQHPMKLKVRTRSVDKDQNQKKNAGFFFSGGIDSYASFIDNRRLFENEHSRSISDGIMIFGL